MARARPSSWYRQSGVVALRSKGGAPQVLLVTSNGGRRWVVPKGIVERGHSPARSAAKEAWEEAGVTGRIARRMTGRYDYEKWGGVCTVRIYRLDVDEVHRDWPEGHRRRRKWFRPRKAAERVGEPALGAIILAVAGSSRAGGRTGERPPVRRRRGL
jgi:8-oxo-dGTP pyrophosphatase MutT (NUDIX family)